MRYTPVLVIVVRRRKAIVDHGPHLPENADRLLAEPLLCTHL